MPARTLNRLGNARQVAALKTDGWHSDGAGLYLRIQNGGKSRSWVHVKVVAGKRTERGLGGYPDVSLADARERAKAPPAEVEAPEAPTVPTFAEFSAAILTDLLPGFKNAKHRQQWGNTLKDYAAHLQPMRLDAITTDDVLAVLRPIWRTKAETASRVRGRIERILGAARAAGHRPEGSQNPATWKDHLSHFLPARSKRKTTVHHKAVPWQAMPAFWAKLAARRDSASADALRFTILTCARTSETTGARWSEIDLEAKLWTVPKERMKMGVEHYVALSPAAIAVLERWHVGVGPNDFVFPGGKKGRGLSNMAMLMLLQGDMEREETVHGFRSAFRDWAGDATDFPRELAEQALAHAVGDATEQAYRRGTAVEKRRPLMAAWAGYLGA